MFQYLPIKFLEKYEEEIKSLPLDLGEKALTSELKRLGQKALENVFLEEESLPITVEDNLQEKNELVEVDINAELEKNKDK